MRRELPMINLGHPSKMPCASYGISALMCKTGSKLAQIPGSVCHGCYALGANYRYPSVTKAHARRLAEIDTPEWVARMCEAIDRETRKTGVDFFRWHDSGDLQSLAHLRNIVRIALHLTHVAFWLPTKEFSLVRQYVKKYGEFPRNLTVRLSAHMVDGKPPRWWPYTSTVHAKAPAQGFTCQAYATASGKCGDCRACWSKDVPNVSYPKH